MLCLQGEEPYDNPVRIKKSFVSTLIHHHSSNDLWNILSRSTQEQILSINHT